MENHILDRLAQPDKDGYYKCDDCEFNSKERGYFGKHFKEKHGSKAGNASFHTDKANTGRKEMEEEIRILKNNFARLETICHDSLDKVNLVKSEYEAKLIS